MDDMWEVREALLRALSERDEARAKLAEAEQKGLNAFGREQLQNARDWARDAEAERDEARAIARRLAKALRATDEAASGYALILLTDFDALAWAKGDAEP